MPPQEKNILSGKRNKVILSLLVYQGLRVEEIAALKLQDLQLREGKITIHAKRGTAARTMKLEWKKGENFYGITQMMLTHLRKINSRIKNLDQVRASVITAWLKQYDLRKVQYLAGHKYVSSTEEYKANVIDELQDDVTKFHPL